MLEVAFIFCLVIRMEMTRFIFFSLSCLYISYPPRVAILGVWAYYGETLLSLSFLGHRCRLGSTCTGPRYNSYEVGFPHHEIRRLPQTGVTCTNVQGSFGLPLVYFLWNLFVLDAITFSKTQTSNRLLHWFNSMACHTPSLPN